jgi:protein-disulfide isomerase
MITRLAAATLLFSLALSAQGLVEGRAGSRVRVLIYEDLQCPDCANFRDMMDRQLLPRSGEQVEFVHRDFPLAKHPNARPAAIAARFFGERDPKLGLEYRRYALSTIRLTTVANFAERLADFARRNGVNPDEAVAALKDPKYEAMVEKDFQDGVSRGIVRTPTVLVNGVPFVETFTFEELSKGIDTALAQAR